MKKNNLFKTILLASIITLSNSSCILKNNFVVIPKLDWSFLVQKGSASLLACDYYSKEDYVEMTDDLSLIENSFKQSGENSKYKMILADGVIGLDLCEQYNNYAYVATIARGNQQLIPLKEIDENKEEYKVILNNEKGSLGTTLKAIDNTYSKLTYNFIEDSDLAFYNALFNGEYIDSEYDYCFISEPYATRLLTVKKSSLYNQSYDEYTNDNRNIGKYDPYKKYYYESLKDFYESENTSGEYSLRGIPQTALFVEKEYYQNNTEKINKVIDYFNKFISQQYVYNVGYTVQDFRDLSLDYADPDKNPDSELTMQAYKVQFDKVGLSWNELPRLQAWHPILGEGAPFEKYVNRLEYSKDIYSYYSIDYLKNYYQFINKEFPSDDNFIIFENK